MTIPNSKTGSPRSRVPFWLLLGLSVAGAAGLGGYYIFWRGSGSMAPPQIEMSGVDPAVQKAIREASEQIKKSKHPADAWGKLGMILFNHKFAAESMTCFEQAERLNGKDMRWPYHQGLILMADDPPRALPKLVRAVQLAEGTLDRPRLRLAELYLQLGRFDDGRKELKVLLASTPAHPRVNLAMARVEFQVGDLEQSRERLQAALVHPLTRRAALRLSAEIQQRLGNAKAAQRDLGQAQTALLPDDPDWPDEILEQTQLLAVGEAAQLQRANKLLDRQRVREAAALLHELVQEYPRCTRAWLLLGYAQMNLRQYPEAEAALQAALKLSPDSASAMLNLGTLKELQQDRPAAIAWYRKAVAQKADAPQPHLKLGQCLKEAGDRQGAIDAFEAALRAHPFSAAAHVQLGELLLREHRWEAARRHLQQAVDLNPEDAAAAKLLAEARKAAAKTMK